MGNEMGNNNVSGLREEDKARTEDDTQKFLQEDSHADELKGENRRKLEAEENDFHEKRKLNENGEATDFHEVPVSSEISLAVEKPREENETSTEDDDYDTEFKHLYVPVEIPPDSNDADSRSEDQEFASSEKSDFSEKTNLDGNILTTAEHGNMEEMLVGRACIETNNQTLDSKAGSGERDLNSYEQEVFKAEQVAEGISIPQSENGHLESNEMVEKMYLCVKPETEDQNVATIMGTLLVKAKADKDEFETLSREDKFDVFGPEEVDICSQNEHTVDQSPLNALQPPQEVTDSAEEASDQQLEALKSPLEESEAPIDTLNSPLETLESPLEVSDSSQEASHPQPLALPLLIKASDSPLEEPEAPLEALNPAMETSEPPLEALESPPETSDQQPLALALLLKDSDPSLEASNSPLETSEHQIETSESSSEDSEPLVEASKSRLETHLEALDSSLEALESPQAGSMKSSQVDEPNEKTINVNEAIPITSERQNGEIKLANNQAQSSEEDDQKFKAFESETSQYGQICVGSGFNTNIERENALCSSLEKDIVIIESDVPSHEPQVALVNQTLKLCPEEQPAMEDSMILTQETNPIGSEVESKENQDDHIKTLFYDQELKSLKSDDSIASQLEFFATETDSTKSGEQSAHEFDSTNGSAENCQLEVKRNEDQGLFADKSLKRDSDEAADTMSETEAVSTESHITEDKHDDDRPIKEIGEKGKEPLLENDRVEEDIIVNSMLPNSGNYVQDVPPYFPDSEAFKDKNELISESKSEPFIITESFHASPSVAIVQSMNTTLEKEAGQNIQETSAMAETSLLLFNEQSAKGQETVKKLMTEPSSDNASNHVEFRKSPSFHFDLSNGSNGDESDQTRLLCHDKSADRSLISRGEAMLPKDNAQIDYNAPQDEPVLAEEKTIRMERSDSERPSAPFLSFLQKEGSAEILATPKKQEKNGADRKTKKDPWTVIHKSFALTSPRDSNGKGKAKSSIFSTCICCASKIP